MKAVVLRSFGPPEVLQVGTWPDPEPGPGTVVVRVRAVALGRTLDLATRAGRLPFASVSLPHILGAEHVGTVFAVGPDVDSVRVGDRVAVTAPIPCGHCRACQADRQDCCPSLKFIGIHQPGAYAEYTLVPAVSVMPLNQDAATLDDVTIAAMALTGPLARYQLDTARITDDSVILVQGGSSALGSMTVVLARLRGARVFATSRDPQKRERLRSLGAEAWDPHAPELVEAIRDATGNLGVDAVFDNLGDAQQMEHDLAVLAAGGTLVTSGAFLGGQPSLDWRSLYSRSLRLIGLRTTNWPSIRSFWSEDVPRGVRAPVDQTFSLDQAAAAHRRLESGMTFGKVLLTVP